MKIFIVNGFPESGKTTFEQYVQSLIGKDFCYIISTVDYVKYIAKLCGWDGTKTPHNRKFLSDLKELLTNWDNVPYKKIVKKIDIIEQELESYDVSSKGVVFVDCREPREIEKLKTGLNAKTILIYRPGNLREYSNSSDRDILGYDYDYFINNSGDLSSLKERAKSFVIDNQLI